MAEDQPFYRQYLQSTGPDGGTTIREVVSPSLLDADAATAAEKQAGRTFSGFVSPDKMADVRATPAPSPPPPPESSPVLPSAVLPTSGAVPASYTAARSGGTAAPGSTPWLNLIPPALATAGPLALSIAQPELGIPLWAASAGLSALGGGGGEALREHLAGEPISPQNIATQGAVSGLTDVAMGQVVTPYVLTPGARFLAGRLGRVLQAGEDLGPVLTSEGTTVTAPAASAPPPPFRTVQLHTIDLATKPPELISVLAQHATDAERPALAAAWVNTTRQAAANAADPVLAMRAAYDALGEGTQRALFGAERGAFERVLNTAYGGTPEEMRNLLESGAIQSGVGYGAHALGLPYHAPAAVGARTVAEMSAPFAARGMLVSPSAARFGVGLSRATGAAGPVVAGFAGQTAAERARQAGLPNF